MIAGSRSIPFVDGLIAGSFNMPQEILKVQEQIEEMKSDSSMIIQKSIDSRAKIIISQIDEEDETQQQEEDENILDQKKTSLGHQTKVNSL